MNIKLNAAIIAAATFVVVLVAALIMASFDSFSVILALIALVTVGGEFAVLYFKHRHVILRKQNIYAVMSIIALGLTLISASAEYSFSASHLPPWCSWLGVVLLISANYILLSSLMSKPRHAKDEYGEDLESGQTALSPHGPYDTIRHPINLAGFLLAFAIPLIFGSAYSLIASCVTAVIIIIHAATIEHYRFEAYSWYYDYTKQVPFMMIPIIW